METDKERLLKELKNNPQVIAYLREFEETSTERFLESYADTKQMLLHCGEQWRLRQHGSDNYFRSCAEKYYWLIAQKKLFNLQCLWRAEQISLPVSVAYEFQYWGDNIKTCSFLEEVTEAEMEAMIRYLEQTPYDHEDNEPCDWQDYDNFKDEGTGIGAGEEYPDWYEAYDNYFGTPHLIALPDVRGKKEEEYCKVWRSSCQKETEIEPQVKPIMFSSSESTEEFIRQVEGYKILDYYRLYQKESIKMEFLEKLEFEIKLLMEEPAEVWMEGGKFPDAIFQASHRLKISYIKSLLPEIHQNHLERKSMGISYEQEHTMQEEGFIQIYRDQIIKGRQILGEPGDLNF